jgi:chaperonin cofactor prefoldin
LALIEQLKKDKEECELQISQMDKESENYLKKLKKLKTLKTFKNKLILVEKN